MSFLCAKLGFIITLHNIVHFQRSNLLHFFVHFTQFNLFVHKINVKIIRQHYQNCVANQYIVDATLRSTSPFYNRMYFCTYCKHYHKSASNNLNTSLYPFRNPFLFCHFLIRRCCLCSCLIICWHISI